MFDVVSIPYMNLHENDVNAYYLVDIKHRVAVARVGGALHALDDLYEDAP